MHQSHQSPPQYDPKRQVYTEGSDPTKVQQNSINIKQLCFNLSKKETLDDRVATALTQLAEDVIEDVVLLACKLAKHRGSNNLEKSDIKFAFEKQFKVKVPSRLVKESNAPVLPIMLVSTANYKANLGLVRRELDRN